MARLRFNVVEEAFKKKAVEVKTPTERPSEYFGKYVFNKEKKCDPYRRTVYWLDKTRLPNPQDYEYIDCVARGLETREFKEMFELV